MLDSRIFLSLVLICALCLSPGTSWADCPQGDMDDDCVVGLSDLVVFADQWLGGDGSADFDGLGGVDYRDFAILAGEWNVAGKKNTLVINEFMTSNTDFILDPQGDDDDWIEIYNYGDEDIELGGMYLTDDLTDPTMWKVLVGPLGETIVPAGGYLLIWADNDGGDGAVHVPFGLAAGGGEDIGLFDSNENLIDSIANFGVVAENHSLGRLPNGTGGWILFGASEGNNPTPGQSNGEISSDEHVMINEIMYYSFNASHSINEDIGEEYIELFNNSDTEVDVSGWRITGGVEFTIPLGTTIQANGYLVIASDIEKFNAVHSGVNNLVGGWVGRLSNKGERLEVISTDGKVIDTVRYSDEGDWGLRRLGPTDAGHRGWMWSDDHDGEGKSLELIAPHMPNEYGQNWASSMTDNGTPGAMNTATGAEGESEILVNTGANWRYLDIGYDLGTASAGTSWFGHPDYDDVWWPYGPSQLGYGDGDEATEVSFGPDSSNKYVTTYFRHTFDLEDASRFTSVTLHLLRDDGAVVYLNGSELCRSNMPNGQITYITFAEDFAGRPEEYTFFEYPVNPALLNTGRNVLAVEVHQESVGSNNPDISFDLILEAEAISVSSEVPSDVAPFIIDTGHNPAIPGSDEEVTVTTRIIDEQNSGVTVTLYHRIDNSSYSKYEYPTHNVSAYDSVVMADDGNHGDGLAGDGVYGGKIPATGSDGAIVEFYVEAMDSEDNSRTFPAPSMVDGRSEQVANLLYQVDNSFDGAADWTAGDQASYRVIMTESERGRLAYIGTSSDRNSNAQMNATFISVDGTGINVRYNTGIRNRGHGSRGNRPNNMRVNFVHDNPWKGVGAVNINARYTYLQYAGSVVYRLAGLYAATASAVHVTVNGNDLSQGGSLSSPMYGSYVHLEVINSEFAENHFPNDNNGNAYKCMRDVSPADFRYLGDDAAPYRNSYFKQTNEAENDYSDIIELCDVLSNTPDDEYVDEVKRVIDTEEWLRYIAMNALLDNMETSIARGYGDDYFLYRGMEDTRFVLIQHDLDTIFDQGDSSGSVTASIFKATAIDAIDRFVNHPEFLPRYYYHLNDLIETVLSSEQLDLIFDQSLGSHVAASRIQDMKDFVSARNDYVLSLIERDFSIMVNLPMANGYRFTNQAVSPIRGTADAIETRVVRVNGQLADYLAKDGLWAVGESATGQARTLISRGSSWNYLDDGSDQQTAWRETGYVMNSNWDSGDAELGYGDDDETTEVGYGPSSSDKYVTTYFRTTFEVADVSKLVNVRLDLLRDDGGIAYLNGAEVARSNMPGILGDDTIDFKTSALDSMSGSEEEVFIEYSVDPSLLVNGINVLAVEVHQYYDLGDTVSSSDISFDLGLVAYESGQSEGGMGLTPGINKLVVETYGDPNGTGEILERGYVDVHYDSGSESTTSGVLGSNMVLDAASGPWHVTGDITVPSGVTLTIEAGTTLFFDAGTGITVTGDSDGLGRLVANGTKYAHIRLTRLPGGGDWQGLEFVNPDQIANLPENRLSYVDMEYGDGQGQSIHVSRSKVHINNMTWSGNNSTAIEAAHPYLLVRDSVFPSISDTESVHGHDLSGDEYCIFEGNTFGKTTGYNDVIDFSACKLPGPILELYNNVFLGGGDDGVDLDGADALLDGNIFRDFLKDFAGSSTCNAVATGQQGDVSDIAVVRNIFFNNEHDVLLKQNCSMWGQNNVFAGSVASISFGEYDRGTSAGKGAQLDSNIFWNNGAVFENNFDPDVDPLYGPDELSVYNSIIPEKFHGLGVGNISDDPLFVDEGGDFHLKSSSPAIGRGLNGIDMGAFGASGALISDGPYSKTHRADAVFTIGGAAVVAYKYRLMDNGSWAGTWSGEYDIATNPEISLSGLLDGHSYTLHVTGCNYAGRWQDEAEAVTWSWTVDTSYQRLVLNEVLADNDAVFDFNGSRPDMIELYYDGASAIDLGGMSVSDDAVDPRQFVFDAGSTINPGEYLVLYCEPNSVEGGHLNFSLDGDGDGVYLFDSLVNGGQLVDSVEFGPQVSDLSIGRSGDDEWALCSPTFGQANTTEPLGDPVTLKINEWYTVGDGDDFIEIFNSGSNPVDLSDLYLTDNPTNEPGKCRLGPLSFVSGYGFVIFVADGRDRAGHVDFMLSAEQEIIGLFDENLNLIDKVVYYFQTANVSQGRVPDGSETLEFFKTATPGTSNRQTVVINEVLSHSHAIDPDWIELYNTTAEPIDIGGWFLSDSSNDLRKYEIAAGTIIDPDDYVLFYENTQFGNPNGNGTRTAFALSENGDEVYLSSGSNGELTEYRIVEDFGASETNVGFGRYLKSTGTYNFVSMSSNTPGYENAYPKVGPVVISEIMYNPAGNDDSEYVELLNISGASIVLYDPLTNEPWKFTDNNGLEYFFPTTPVSMISGERILLVKDRVSFDLRFGAPEGTQIFEWGLTGGGLSNAGEKIQLSKPGDVNGSGQRQYIRVDRVNYSDGSHPVGQDPWPMGSDGDGKSLERINPGEYGNDFVNWQDADSTPGAP